jgi:hypothetical protein
VLVAHACNPRYSGGRDQEDHVSKSALANRLWPYLEKTHHNERDGGVVQGIGPEFKPQYCKKKKKRQYEVINTTFYSTIKRETLLTF